MAQLFIVLVEIKFRNLQELSTRFVKSTGKDSSEDKDFQETRYNTVPMKRGQI